MAYHGNVHAPVGWTSQISTTPPTFNFSSPTMLKSSCSSGSCSTPIASDADAILHLERRIANLQRLTHMRLDGFETEPQTPTEMLELLKLIRHQGELIGVLLQRDKLYLEEQKQQTWIQGGCDGEDSTNRNSSDANCFLKGASAFHYHESRAEPIVRRSRSIARCDIGRSRRKDLTKDLARESIKLFAQKLLQKRGKDSIKLFAQKLLQKRGEVQNLVLPQ
eukprot:TRINITY_DN7479_c1_g1_i12.p1 TRINITY_DN7479_c1_g1~~TRINITY_DN7479_c1_g1_i12.p1  ORF type:complete len:221 (+),score=21.72 TRINITY_DN7479_c1_g1_i12:125-787(+)